MKKSLGFYYCKYSFILLYVYNIFSFWPTTTIVRISLGVSLWFRLRRVRRSPTSAEISIRYGLPEIQKKNKNKNIQTMQCVAYIICSILCKVNNFRDSILFFFIFCWLKYIITNPTENVMTFIIGYDNE